jgi:hypothetical protein
MSEKYSSVDKLSCNPTLGRAILGVPDASVSHGDALNDHVTFRDVVHRVDLEAAVGGEG